MRLGGRLAWARRAPRVGPAFAGRRTLEFRLQAVVLEFRLQAALLDAPIRVGALWAHRFRLKPGLQRVVLRTCLFFVQSVFGVCCALVSLPDAVRLRFDGGSEEQRSRGKQRRVAGVRLRRAAGTLHWTRLAVCPQRKWDDVENAGNVRLGASLRFDPRHALFVLRPILRNRSPAPGTRRAGWGERVQE